jgi:hypothetical protein
MTVPTTAQIKSASALRLFPSRSAAVGAGDADSAQNLVSRLSIKTENSAVDMQKSFMEYLDLGAPNDTKYPNSQIGDSAIEIGIDDEVSSTAQYTADKWLKTQAGWVNLLGLARKITDPGDAGAVPAVASGTCAIVTEGAETRTLAIPTFLGQQICLCFQTDGGNAVVTVASAVNQTGNNTLTFADAGDEITLKAVQNGAALAWRVVSNDGVALSTV